MDEKELFVTAELAMLELGADEVDKLGRAVTEILDYFTKMTEIDVDDLEPTSHALAKRNRLREDVAAKAVEIASDKRGEKEQPERRETALKDISDVLVKNSPESEDRFITIPKVL